MQDHSILVQKVLKQCPLCGRPHFVEERMSMARLEIKGETVTYNRVYYLCPRSQAPKNLYAEPEQNAQSMLNARNAYRTRHGMMTSSEIIKLRQKYDLSQEELSRILGWGDGAISRYETKSIQDSSYDRQLQSFRDDPSYALELLPNAHKHLPQERIEAIRQTMLTLLEESGKEYLSRRLLKSYYAAFADPADPNHTVLHIDKLEALLALAAKRGTELSGRFVRVYLRYVDWMSIRETGQSLTGLLWQETAHGSIPVGWHALTALDWLQADEARSNHENSASEETDIHDAIWFFPSEKIDRHVLSEPEQSLAISVLEQLNS